MGNVGKIILMGAAAYLVAVGIAQYVSGNSTDSPTADKLAAWPSLGSASLNLLLGGGLLVFHKQIGTKLGV